MVSEGGSWTTRHSVTNIFIIHTSQARGPKLVYNRTQSRNMFARNALRQSSSALRGQVRCYADPPAGSVAGSGDAFSKRERAAENQYMQEREKEKNEVSRLYLGIQGRSGG